jgi:hypothetical protein
VQAPIVSRFRLNFVNEFMNVVGAEVKHSLVEAALETVRLRAAASCSVSVCVL